MKLEKQVCNLELAQKLKELGVPQESLWVWLPYLEDDESTRWEIERRRHGLYGPVAAFTVAELGEMLPPTLGLDFDIELYVYDHPRTYDIVACDYKGEDGAMRTHFTARDKNEANARAKMLIYLLENKLSTSESLSALKE